MRWLRSVPAALLVTALHGCGCDTSAACDNDDAATFYVADRDWEAEQDVVYTFTLTFDGRTHVCTGRLGDRPACDSNAVRVNTFLRQGAVMLENIVVRSLPDQIELTVEQDGLVVLDETYDVVVTKSRCPDCAWWTTSIHW